MILILIICAICLVLSLFVNGLQYGLGVISMNGAENATTPGDIAWWFLVFATPSFLLLWWALQDIDDENDIDNARPERSKKNELGSGDLASDSAILNWTKPTGGQDTELTVKELRGRKGLTLKEGKLIIPKDQRNRHTLIIAKTGSGKTTRLILPVLYSDCLCPVRSTVIIDSKPEMWEKLAGLTRRHNPKKNIMLFNPLDTVRGLSWNILSKIEDDTDAKLIANTVIMATDNPSAKSDSPFFRNNALAVLTSLMVGLLNDKSDKLSMPRIHRLVNSGKLELCDWLEAHPEALITSKTFVELARSGSQNADTILSELGMRLGAWDLKAIRSTTFLNELDLEKLISDPTLFIVELRESEIEMLRPMANVIVVEILRYLTKRAESCPGQTLPRPVGLVIDEFASALGRLPDIHVKLNTLRSRNVSIVAAIQTIGQIKAAYQQDADSVLAGFATKIFMPALDFQDAEWASKESGTMTVRYKTASTGSSRKIVENFASNNVSHQEVVQQRAVLTPDEIGRPANNICTFFMPSTPVFQGHLVPYYEDPKMSEDFKSSPKDFTLRSGPIDYKDEMVGAISAPAKKNTSQLSKEELTQLLQARRAELQFEQASASAQEWWTAFESMNQDQLSLMVDLTGELIKRKSNIGEFFYAYAWSGGKSIDESLAYIDKMRKEQATSTQEGTTSPVVAVG